MAVTITETELIEELRQSNNPVLPEETRRFTRWRAIAVTWVERYAPDAPEEVQNEAVMRVVAYLLEIPAGPYVSQSVGNASATYPSGSRAVFRHSGAMGLLSPYKQRRAGAIG